MSYQALYRKYRPSNFNDVVGQEVVVETLKNALKTNKMSHAYMFSGPRGTGKTTIAKILAKAINCDSLIDGISCDNCEKCLSIINNESTDIIEIDAASNNGVDEIREIRNKINLVPSELKYKVYIIDEVHMLSIGAFNALLKTLEEPPAHVIFILATTDPHKVPVTIISRCQCFEFKRINDRLIVERLENICSKENITIQTNVLEKIAKISEGGMRDSLGILDKVSSYSTELITLDIFNDINGLVDDDIRSEFLLSVFNKDFSKILEITDMIYNSGKNFIIFVQDLIEDLRNYMIDYYINGNEIYSIEFVLSFIKSLNELLINLKNVNNLKVMFEASILSFVDKSNDREVVKMENKIVDNDSLIKITEKNIVKTEEKNIDVPVKEEKNYKINESVISKDKSLIFAVVNNTFATAKKEYLLNLKENWFKLNDFVLDKSYGAAACFLIDSVLRAVGENEFIITCSYESVQERGFTLLSSMEELIAKVFNKNYKIALLTDDEWNVERQKFIDLKSQGKKYEYKDIDTLVKKSDIIDVSEQKIEESDDLVQQAISIFGEDIVKISE